MRDPVLKLNTKPIQSSLPVPNQHVSFLPPVTLIETCVLDNLRTDHNAH
jgi:hypothetical protein